MPSDFEALGEHEVRKRLVLRQFTTYDETLLAEEWLRQRAESRNESRMVSAERRAVRAEIIAIIAAATAIIVSVIEALKR